MDSYSVEAASKANRENPVTFFCQFLERIWQDNSEAEATILWQRQIRSGRWYAEDILFCLDAVIANPPINLAELMQEHGWIMLEHDPQPYTLISKYNRQYLEWLKSMNERFKAVFQAETSGQEDV